MSGIIDLRSDTVTHPTDAMLQAMAEAPLGDDVFGDDPSVNALQEKISGMLGFEAGLFMPSGTMSNLCAIVSHCQRGDEYIVGQLAHCYRCEAGGAAVLGSVQPQPLEHQPDGTLALEDILAAIKPDDIHYARTRLLAIENTLGGKLIPFDYLEQATQLAKRNGLSCHLDGARLFNAATAQADAVGSNSYDEARRISGCFDSVSVCLSKGLGAPIGSILCGNWEFIEKARRFRKMAGGGMRQAGMLAAAGIYALDNHVSRLKEDHLLAKRLADGLTTIPMLEVEEPETNIVFVNLIGSYKGRSRELTESLKEHGILVNGTSRLRFVTHLDVDSAGIDATISMVGRFFGDQETVRTGNAKRTHQKPWSLSQ
jgi:threonine aldolase